MNIKSYIQITRDEININETTLAQAVVDVWYDGEITYGDGFSEFDFDIKPRVISMTLFADDGTETVVCCDDQTQQVIADFVKTLDCCNDDIFNAVVDDMQKFERDDANRYHALV